MSDKKDDATNNETSRSEPDRVDRAGTERMIQRADDGDRYSLRMLYGLCKFWLLQEKPLPPLLSAFAVGVFGRLEQVAAESQLTGKDPAEEVLARNLAEATLFRRKTKGRPKSRVAEAADRELASEVASLLLLGTSKEQTRRFGIGPTKSVESACANVAAMREWHGKPVSVSRVRRAWARFRQEFRDFQV